MAISERLALIVTMNPGDAVRGFATLSHTADKSLTDTSDKVDRLGQRFTKAGAVMLTAGAVAAAGLFKAGQAAAELEQQVGGTEAVFGEAASTIDDFAKTSARSVGLSETEFRRLSTTAGAMLKNLGASTQEAAEQSVQLVEIGADLAATFGGTTTDAVEALGSALRGEADPAERFGLRLNINAVNAKAVALGLAESTAEVDNNAKRQATLALILEQSADSQGQFARETGTASGQMQIARAELDNLIAQLGGAAAPIIADVAGFVGTLGQKFNELPPGIKETVSQVAVGTTGLLLFGGAASTIIGKLILMRDSITKAIVSMQTMAAASGVSGAAGSLGGFLSVAGRVAGVLAPVGVAVAAVGFALDAQNDRHNAQKAALADLASAYQASGGDMVEALRRVVAVNDDLFESLAGAGGNEARDRLEDLGYTVEGFTSALGSGYQEFSNYTDRVLASADAAGYSYQEHNRLRLTFNEVADGVRSVSDEATRQETLMTGAAGATGDNADAVGELGDAAVLTTEQINGLLDAVLAQFDAEIAAEQSTDRLEQAVADLTAANDTAAAAGYGNADANEALDDALLGARDAALQQAGRMGDLAVQQAGVAGTADEAAVRNDAMRTALIQLADRLAPGSPLRVYLDQYVATLNTVPHDVNTNVTTTFRTIGGDTGAIPSGKRAAGGPVSANKLYRVGEEGEEWFVPDKDGTIIPNDLVRSAMAGGSASSFGGGSSGAAIVVNLYGKATYDDGEQVVDALARYVKSNGQLPSIVMGN